MKGDIGFGLVGAALGALGGVYLLVLAFFILMF